MHIIKERYKIKHPKFDVAESNPNKSIPLRFRILCYK